MTDRLNDLGVRQFVERLATKDPVPGGGSAAALAGATGAALMSMVVQLTTGRPGAAEHEEELTRIGVQAASLQSSLLNLVESDAAAYDSVIAARRLPRGTDLERSAREVQLAGAVREATLVPLTTARAASDLLTLAEGLAPIGSRNAISDVGVGALLAVVALRGAELNVRINLPYLPEDEPLRGEAPAALDELLDGIDERAARIRTMVTERMG